MDDELYTVRLLITTIHTDLEELSEAARLYGENDFRKGQLFNSVSLSTNLFPISFAFFVMVFNV